MNSKFAAVSCMSMFAYGGPRGKARIDTVCSPRSGKFLSIAAVLLFPAFLSAQAEEVISKGFTAERYQEMWERNPFIVSIRKDLDPKKVEVVLSNGQDEGIVRFNFEAPEITEAARAKKAEASRPAPQRGSGQAARAEQAGGQKSSERSADSSQRYPLPPGMNQYNQRAYGEYIQELQRQRQPEIQKKQQYQQSAQQ
jgi:hypothetical protein